MMSRYFYFCVGAFAINTLCLGVNVYFLAQGNWFNGVAALVCGYFAVKEVSMIHEAAGNDREDLLCDDNPEEN